jgi:hypothetical protein
MTGAADPATGLARKIQDNPCSIPGACTNFTDAAPVMVSATPIQSANVVYDMYEYVPGALKIKSTYKVDGTIVDMTSVFDTAAGTRVPCTSVLAQGSRLYTCNITVVTAARLQLTATAPNVAKVTEPLVQVVSYTSAGEALSHWHCGSTWPIVGMQVARPVRCVILHGAAPW